jgi:hypothetical protein
VIEPSGDHRAGCIGGGRHGLHRGEQTRAVLAKIQQDFPRLALGFDRAECGLRIGFATGEQQSTEEKNA